MTTCSPIATRLSGRPLAMAPRALDSVLATAFDPGLSVPSPGGTAPYAVTDGGIAVIPVVGVMVSRGDWLSALFGAISYADIGDVIAAAFADPSVRAVLLEMDSPGGEVGGLFDLTDRITALRQASGKPLWVVASESALSAGYAIASTADRLYVTRTGEVGSVGVVAVHVDESAADAMAGLKWTLIQAGARKTDGNPHEPLTAPALTAIQADVDALYDEFVALVARNRGLSPDAVRATEAAIYRGSRGIDAGLADQVGTVAQALADLTAALDTPRPRAATPSRHPPLASAPLERRSPSMTTSAPADPPAAPDPGPATPPAPPPASPTIPPAPPAPPVPPAAPDTTQAEALRAEYAEIADVAAQAARLGVTLDAADAMRKGIRPDALRRSVLDTLAARGDASAFIAAAPAPATAGDSPIVRRARERAAAAARS